MELIVLGAAAGGGLPQWNCIGGQSRRAWSREIPTQTQASVAIGSRQSGYVVINASPDLRTQILQTRALQPNAHHPDGPRNTPIRAVIVTNADVDNIAGLLNLREKQSFSLYGPDAVMQIIGQNSIFQVLDPDFVNLQPLEAGTAITPVEGLSVELFHVAGKPPLYLEADLGIESGSSGFTSGVEVQCGARRILVISSCAHIDAALKQRIQGADVLLFDGTVFEDDEMIQQGLGHKTGRRMGHLPITAADGPLIELSETLGTRKLFFHINNTNPIWDIQSSAFQTITDAGWEVSHDGMVIPL